MAKGLSDLVGGQISMALDATPTAMPQVQAGTIRAIGGGMATRARALPDLPTLQEQGIKDLECYTRSVILAPRKTSPQIIARRNEAINKALANPAVFRRLPEVGVDPGTTPAGVVEFVKAEFAKWGPIIKASVAELD